MIKNNIQISIITLTKNNKLELLKTLKSIENQHRNFLTELIIIDGSNKNQFIKNKNLIDKNFFKKNIKDIFVNQISSENISIKGIYPCMNYGKKIAKGTFIIFLNSGDTFFNNMSLQTLFNKSLYLDSKRGLIFGQAKIISPTNINWYFPGKRLKNFERWLKIFEPNHQSMLVANQLANKYDFPLNVNSLADGYWKRNIINNSSEIIYIEKPIIKFYLNGISSSKPSKKFLSNIIKNKEISIFRKFTFLIKYILPLKLFYLYYLSQKLKSLLIDLII